MIKEKTIAIVLTTLLIIAILPANGTTAQATPAYYDEAAIGQIADGIIRWKKTTLGLSGLDSLIEKGLSATAGTSNADWFAIGAKRIGDSGKTADYLFNLGKLIAEYRAGKNKSANLSDMQRSMLVIYAMGSDPASFAIPIETTPGSYRSENINLLSDYVYNRSLTTPLDSQLINWWSWGLVALDANQYTIPANSAFTRDSIIMEILRRQKTAGGFALMDTDKNSDPDITAMVVQALSPYYNSEKVYSYTRMIDRIELKKTVRQAVDEALVKLSSMQLDTGDYKSWGQRSAETGAQVALALCSLGIDPQKDSRFIKNGKTLMDGILLYKNPDGGFSHSLPLGENNDMTNAQILYSMAGILRQMRGQRVLYDFRPEQNAPVKTAILKLTGSIAQITPQTSKTVLLALLSEYNAVVDNERMYVYNYGILKDALKNAGVSQSASEAGYSKQPGVVSSQALSGSAGQASLQPGGTSALAADASDGAPLEDGSRLGPDSGERPASASGADAGKPRNKTIQTLLALLAIALLLAGMGLWSFLQKRKHKQM